MKFSFKDLQAKAKDAFTTAQAKTEELKAKAAPFVEQAADALVKADKAVTEKVDQAVAAGKAKIEEFKNRK